MFITSLISGWKDPSETLIHFGPFIRDPQNTNHHLALVHPKSQKNTSNKKRSLPPLRRISVVFKTPPPPSPVEIRWQFRVVSAQRQGRYPVTKTRKYMIRGAISAEIIRLKGDIISWLPMHPFINLLHQFSIIYFFWFQFLDFRHSPLWDKSWVWFWQIH